ncbi:hypothetical protein Pfo_016979 [Paulownia fortunei]|nr:hypothetical protein Pfo_016979 [Paulownia fortunei]
MGSLEISVDCWTLTRTGRKRDYRWTRTLASQFPIYTNTIAASQPKIFNQSFFFFNLFLLSAANLSLPVKLVYRGISLFFS